MWWRIKDSAVDSEATAKPVFFSPGYSWTKKDMKLQLSLWIHFIVVTTRKDFFFMVMNSVGGD